MPRAKKPVFPRFTDLPPKLHECFNNKEWNEWWRQYNYMFGHLKRPLDVYAAACEDCELSYQVVSMMQGSCLPPDPSATPAARYFETGDSELEELPLVDVR